MACFQPPTCLEGGLVLNLQLAWREGGLVENFQCNLEGVANLTWGDAFMFFH